MKFQRKKGSSIAWTIFLPGTCYDTCECHIRDRVQGFLWIEKPSGMHTEKPDARHLSCMFPWKGWSIFRSSHICRVENKENRKTMWDKRTKKDVRHWLVILLSDEKPAISSILCVCCLRFPLLSLPSPEERNRMKDRWCNRIRFLKAKVSQGERKWMHTERKEYVLEHNGRFSRRKRVQPEKWYTERCVIWKPVKFWLPSRSFLDAESKKSTFSLGACIR